MPKITNTSRIEQVIKTKDGKFVGLASGATETIDADVNDRGFIAKVKANNIALGTEEQTQKVKERASSSDVPAGSNPTSASA